MSSARYRIAHKIADGGMAELYLGVQRGVAGFERPIVVKRVRASCFADPGTREALVDEAHVAMSLIHSNIVQVLDLGFSSGRYFLVLELVDGWDLSVLLDRAKGARHPLPPELAIHVTTEVCRALAFAHGRATKDGTPLSIVHRDVNPHNVLVSEQGEVKLTDFGIATARTRRGVNTKTGLIKGKLGFMSPEQAAGKPLDARSDLFSLGCTLYQLITGVGPFGSGAEVEMLVRMEACDFKPAEQVKRGLPAPLAALLRKAMKKDPADRYPNAEAMLADLERVQRSVFKPAGQSELKAWLADLARLDQVPTIGKRPAPKEQSGHGELAPGSELVLDEADLSIPPRSVPVSKRKPAPEPRPAPAQPPLPPADAFLEPPTLPPFVKYTALGLVLFVAAMTATVFWARPRARQAELGLATPAQQRAQAMEILAGKDEPEVEIAYPIPEEVSVAVETSPAGAAISLNGKPAGTTPTELKLKPGRSYELRLEKAGYRPVIRKVSPRIGARVSVTLEKPTWYSPR